MGCDQTDTSSNGKACGPQNPLPSAGSKIENQAAEKCDDPIIAILEASGLAGLQPRANPGAVEDALRALAALIAGADDIRLASVREAALKKLADIGIGAPARLIDASMVSGGKITAEATGPTPFLPDPSPWDTPIDSCELLDEVAGLIRRYVVLSTESANTIALWVLHAWALSAFDISPILCITSPTKRCGKTTLLEILSYISPRAISASNATPASVFRILDKFSPVLLIDEADTFLNRRAELRGIINSGHRRSSAFVIRTVGEEHGPRQFSTWGAKAIALIDRLPSTLEDRSIVIELRRRAASEIIAPFRSAECRAAAEPIKRKAFRWAKDHLVVLRAIDPKIPDELNDRAKDNWRPLVSIAVLAGGEWPRRARSAARALAKEFDETDGEPLVDLLKELHHLFQNADGISSAELAGYLASSDEKRWAEWSHSTPISQRQVARLLDPLKIKPHTIRIAGKTAKGYRREWFDDAFARYLPGSDRNTVTSAHYRKLTPEGIRNNRPDVTDGKTS